MSFDTLHRRADLLNGTLTAVLGLVSMLLVWGLLALLNLDNIRAMHRPPPALDIADIQAIIQNKAVPTTYPLVRCLAEHGHGLSAAVLIVTGDGLLMDVLHQSARRALAANYVGEAAILSALAEHASDHRDSSLPVSPLVLAQQYLLLPWVGVAPWSICQQEGSP